MINAEEKKNSCISSSRVDSRSPFPSARGGSTFVRSMSFKKWLRSLRYVLFIMHYCGDSSIHLLPWWMIIILRVAKWDKIAATTLRREGKDLGPMSVQFVYKLIKVYIVLIYFVKIKSAPCNLLNCFPRWILSVPRIDISRSNKFRLSITDVSGKTAIDDE